MNDDKIMVSIGIPFYNAEKYLNHAIRSVVNQTYSNWELILLDDGSTDSSLKIAMSYNDQRIRVVTDGENMGLTFRLNQFLELISGNYYARMDADDIMHFDRITRQVAYLNVHQEVDVVGSSYFSIDSLNQIIGINIVNSKPNSQSAILKNGCFAHPTIMGRTEWFKKNSYDVAWNRMEDFELWIRTVTFSNFKIIEEPLLFYRNVGIPTINKYIKSNIGIIKLLQRRRRYGISRLNSIRFSTLYLMKISAYIFFFCIGKMDYLIKKRSHVILDLQKINAEELLSRSIL